MRTRFSDIPTRTVTLTHGAESVTLRLRPPPLGFGEMLERVLPAEPFFVNGKPAPDTHPEAEARRSEALILRMYARLAHALGDQVEARPPDAGANPDAWRAYARAVRQEMIDAHLLDGDIGRLMEELAQVNRGAGELGNG